MIILFLAFLSIAFLFWALLPQLKLLENVALSYLFSLGSFTFLTFLMMVTGFPLNAQSITTLVLAVFTGSLLVLLKQKGFAFFTKSIPITWEPSKRKMNGFLIAALALLVGFVLLHSWFWPATDWDSLVLYDFRAKSFALSGGMQEAISQGYFFGYPLLLSLSHAWVYILTSGYPSFLHAFLYVAFLAIFYIHLKKETKPTTALLATLFLGSTRVIFGHAQMTYSNLPYTVFLVSGYLYLYRFIKQKRLSDFLISGLLVGFSTWTRSVEPFWITSVILAAIVVFSDQAGSRLKKLWQTGLYFLLVSIIRYPWLAFEGMHLQNQRDVLQKAPGYLDVLTQFDWNNLSTVSQYLYTTILKPELFLYGAFLVAFFSIRRNALAHYFFPLTVLLNLGLIFVGTLILSLTFTTWNQIGGSVTRLSMIFIPLLLFEVTLTFNTLFSKKS